MKTKTHKCKILYHISIYSYVESGAKNCKSKLDNFVALDTKFLQFES